MSLPLHLFIHITFSLLAGFVVWRLWRRPAISFVVALCGGFLIDLDHFIDYFIAFGFKFNREYFFNGYYSLKDDRLYYLFHGWEYVVLFLVLSLFFKNIKMKSFFLALSLGMFFHLMVDSAINGGMTAKGYSIIYRVENKFKIEKIITFEGYQQHLSRKQDVGLFSPENVAPALAPSEDAPSVEDVQETPTVSSSPVAKNISMNVPFVLQAPFGNWKDQLFQDACEEAAILMADGWLKEKTDYTKEQMELEIRKISDLEKKMLDGYIDASAEDTAKILKVYTGHEKAEVVENVKLDDIKNEIFKGALVIVPTDGRKLGNPFYTAPGPVTHMLVIVGYDVEKKEFITNDSGTKRGENYRYAESILFAAIRDYPTGNHHIKPFSEAKTKKTMIVVSK